MNPSRTNRPGRLILVAVALFTTLGATACGGKAQKADRAPTERRVLQTQAPPPTAEVLKDSPCGNPDWARPPGTAGEEAVDAVFRTTNREKSAARQTENNTDPSKENSEENSEEAQDTQDQIGDSPAQSED